MLNNRHHPFFDADKGGGGNEKIEIVYQGEVIDSVEVPAGLPESVKVKIKQGMEKGTLYDKKMHTIAEQEKALVVQQTQLEQVQTILDKAREDEGYRTDQFIPNLEAELGFKLAVGEAEGMLDLDGDSKVVTELQSKIDKLEKRVDSGDQKGILREIEIAHKKCESQFNAKEGYPKYDREKVQKYIDENQFIIPDIESNYEQAYFLANKTEIFEAERKLASKDVDTRLKFIKDNKSGGDSGGADPKIDVSTKAMNDVQYQDYVLEQAKARGESFYSDD